MMKNLEHPNFAELRRADRITHQIGQFRQNNSGLAAVEFAFIAPIMVFLFFAVVEGADALSAGRRVALSANTLADLVAQEPTITKSELDDLFIGMEDIVSAQDINIDFRILSITKDPDNDKIIVQWSYGNQNSRPYAPGSEFTGLPDDALLGPGASLVVSEVDFAYTSQITQRLISSLTIARTATRWPRRSVAVELCNTSTSC